jgi:hypothetical protein
VTDQPKADDPSAAAPARHRHRLVEGGESKSFFQLIPRRDLTRIVLLVLILVVVVALQRRSGGIIKSLNHNLSAPAPQVQPKEPPRVRLAPAPR